MENIKRASSTKKIEMVIDLHKSGNRDEKSTRYEKYHLFVLNGFENLWCELNCTIYMSRLKCIESMACLQMFSTLLDITRGSVRVFALFLIDMGFHNDTLSFQMFAKNTTVLYASLH